MTFIDLLFIVVTFLWLLEFFIFRNKNDSNERSSYLIILLCMIVSIFISILFHVNEWLFIPLSSVSWIGITIYASGIGLRYWSMIKLGQAFTRNISVSEHMSLVSEGPYRRLRHPLYTGLLLCIVGISVYLQTWGGILISIILVGSALLYRIHLEESSLSDVLHDTYDDWKKKRWVLIPWIY